jgi:hypothetical protein
MSVLEGIDIVPSAATARFEIVGIPRGPAEAALLRDSEIAGALARLDSRRITVNNRLALDAAALAEHLVSLDEGAVAYLRWANVVVSFSGEEARRLTTAATAARTRPLDFLRSFCLAADARLAEPRRGSALDTEPLLAEAAGRRELMLRVRDATDAIEGAEQSLAIELRSFRASAVNALHRPPGIHRSGGGRLVETVLASIVGTLTLACLSGGVGRLPLLVESSLAAALATAAILLLEGTFVLPWTPYEGVSRAFVPMSFGWGVAVSLVSRLAASPMPSPASTAEAPSVANVSAHGPRTERELEVDPSAIRSTTPVRTRSNPDVSHPRNTLPFFPKTRTARR